jgi:DNA-binding CsgD family transcriptional regulator
VTIPFMQLLLCPVLIGRTPQLDALRQSIDRVCAGHAQTVLIAGEAGIGKSRLVAEARAYAAACGINVLQAGSFSQDSACPYAPLLDLLRAGFAGRAPEAIAADVGPFARDLALLLPDLVPFPAELAPLVLDPEQQKRRLFEALIHCLIRRAAPQPTLLIIEDLHWSDAGSLDFLLYLVRHVADQPLLLIGTYRSDEVGSGLQRWLANLGRERFAQELPLTALTRDEVALMLRAIFALRRPVRVEFLETIYTLAEGNPFYVEELLTSLVAAGDIFYADGTWDRKPMQELRIPRTLHEAVRQRVGQLSADARNVVILAAAVGRRFDFALLQRLAQIGEGDLLRRIKELIAAQLVVEESAEQFAFRHALTRQAIYTELLARERAAMHRTIAEMIEKIYEDTLELHTADLAYHFYAAGIWERALEYGWRAGARAQALGVPYAAIAQFTRALDAASRLSVTPDPMLHLARGHAYEIVGDFERACEDYEVGLRLARAAGNGMAEWQSMIDLGQLWAGRDYEQTGAWFRSALDRAATLNDPMLPAHSLNRLGNWLMNTGQATEGLRAHHEALALFQAQHDQQGVAETHDLLGMAYALAGNQVYAAHHFQQAIDLLRTLNDQRNLSSSLATHAINTSPGHAETTLLAPGTFESCITSATEALYLARQLDWRAGQSFAEWQIGLAAAGFGQFDMALAHANESLRIALEIDHQQWIAGARFTLGVAYVRMLVPEAALEQLLAGLPLAHTLKSAWWIGNITAYLALAYLLKHDLAHAESVLAKALPLDVLRARPPCNLPERRVAWVWGELALARGDSDQALWIAELLIDSAPGTPRGQPIPALLKLKGEALLALHRPGEAALALVGAQRGAEERGERPLLWPILRTLGQTHRRLGQRQQARQAFNAARDLVESLAATIDDPDLREQFVRTAYASLPKARSPAPRRAMAARFGGLTIREREVARQIAQGKSNQDIADALVVTKRTVESHVGTILAKLGVRTRAQIAVWASEAGLLRNPE